MTVRLEVLEEKDEKEFIKDNQYALKYGAEQYFDGEVARFPYTKICENRLKSKAIQGGFRFFYGIQEVYN